MVSAVVSMAIWRVEHDVIAGFYRPAKPAMFSMYRQLDDSWPFVMVSQINKLEAANLLTHPARSYISYATIESLLIGY